MSIQWSQRVIRKSKQITLNWRGHIFTTEIYKKKLETIIDLKSTHKFKLIQCVIICSYKHIDLDAEMEYCASSTSMLAEEIWQIAKGFVEVPTYL